MKLTRASCCTLCGALVWMAGAPLFPGALAAPAVDEMSPAELRSLFRAPGLIVPDGLGAYNEDYRTVMPMSKEDRGADVAVAGGDRETVCAALGDALNYLRGRALKSRRVAYGSDTDILRWYNRHCLKIPVSEKTSAAKSPVDPVTLAALRRIVLSHPQESLDAY